jgi:hypothetical protein
MIDKTDREAGWIPIDSQEPGLYQLQAHAPGPAGALPLDADFLATAPSGHLFGLTQDAGMGWDPALLRRREFLILSTLGGIRSPDGTPVALGYHTGHWEVGLLMQAAAEDLPKRVSGRWNRPLTAQDFSEFLFRLAGQTRQQF